MKVLVCGGRNYHDVVKIVNRLADVGVTHLIVGDANGADAIAAAYCLGLQIPVAMYKADWDKYDKAAGPIRNKEMLDENPDIDLVLRFPGGIGTANMASQAVKRKIRIVQA